MIKKKKKTSRFIFKVAKFKVESHSQKIRMFLYSRLQKYKFKNSFHFL